MGRVTIKVDQKLLAQSISHAEKDGPLKNLSALWEKASTIYNDLVGATSLPEISPSVVMLRAGQWKIPHVTVGGKKGKMTAEHKAAMLAGRAASGPIQRKPRAEKFATNPQVQAAHDRLERVTPERFQPLVAQVRAGSRTAAVKLNCLECSAYVTSEVRQCVCVQCPLWAFRPYQGSVESDEDVEIETEELVAEVA